MEEKDRVKTISKEMIERLINSFNRAEKEIPIQEEKNLDRNKVKEIISNLEGCSPHTVVCILSTACVLLPTDAIMTVISLAKNALTVKAMTELVNIFGNEYHNYNNIEE